MRKPFLPAVCYVLHAILLTAGCQKIKDVDLVSEDDAQLERRGGHREECRLTSFVWDNNSSEFYHYNN